MKKYTDKTIWEHGTHKGKALANIPDNWFQFMWDNGCKVKVTKDVRLEMYIKENADVLKIRL